MKDGSLNYLQSLKVPTLGRVLVLLISKLLVVRSCSNKKKIKFISCALILLSCCDVFSSEGSFLKYFRATAKRHSSGNLEVEFTRREAGKFYVPIFRSGLYVGSGRDSKTSTDMFISGSSFFSKLHGRLDGVSNDDLYAMYSSNGKNEVGFSVILANEYFNKVDLFKLRFLFKFNVLSAKFDELVEVVYELDLESKLEIRPLEVKILERRSIAPDRIKNDAIPFNIRISENGELLKMNSAVDYRFVIVMGAFSESNARIFSFGEQDTVLDEMRVLNEEYEFLVGKVFYPSSFFSQKIASKKKLMKSGSLWTAIPILFFGGPDSDSNKYRVKIFKTKVELDER